MNRLVHTKNIKANGSLSLVRDHRYLCVIFIQLKVVVNDLQREFINSEYTSKMWRYGKNLINVKIAIQNNCSLYTAFIETI